MKQRATPTESDEHQAADEVVGVLRRGDGPLFMYLLVGPDEPVWMRVQGFCGNDPLLGWSPDDPLECIRVPEREDLVRVQELGRASRSWDGQGGTDERSLTHEDRVRRWMDSLEAWHRAAQIAWERGARPDPVVWNRWRDPGAE